MKRIFTLLTALVLSVAANAQDVMGICGAFTGWGSNPDITMTSGDGIQWNASAVVITEDGGLKFRLNSDWAANWGHDGTAGFPTGTAVAGGFGNDIPAIAGTYDVSFNTSTLEYSFTAVATGFDIIGFNGGFNSFGTPVELITANGNQYGKSDFYFNADGIKFVNSTSNQTFGGSAFPSGVAVLDGPAIPLTSGYYSVGFDKTIPGYAFVQSFVGIIGSAVPNTGWDTCVTMTSTDGGITNTLSGFTLTDGAVKFRVNGSWTTNYGGTTFPTGTSVAGDGDLSVTAGTYDITFNRVTGEYNFGLASLTENQMIKVSVAPNPANELVNFTVDASEFVISIIDLSGKVVATSTSSELNVAQLNSGIYTYLVSTSNGVATGKLIKQ